LFGQFSPCAWSLDLLASISTAGALTLIAVGQIRVHNTFSQSANSGIKKDLDEEGKSRRLSCPVITRMEQ